MKDLLFILKSITIQPFEAKMCPIKRIDMYKYLIIILSYLIISCNSNKVIEEGMKSIESDKIGATINIEVKIDTFDVVSAGWGWDCGLPLIEFKADDYSKISALTGVPYWTVYHAYNLDNKFNDKGCSITVTLRKVRDDELSPCTMKGPSYPWVTVIDAKWTEESDD